jgi:Protein of unknown function (DUF3987)
MMAPLSAFKMTSEQVTNGRLFVNTSVIKDLQPPKLDHAALYGVCGQIVGKVLPHTEADPAALLLTLLAGLGNIMGRNPYYIVDGAWHHVNLFTAIVGDSSSGRKGTSWENCKRVFKAVDPDWYSNKVMSGIGSGEGVILQLKDADDPTLELFSDKRLFIKEGEFAQTLQVMSRSGNTVSPMIRNAWDDGSLQNMTKNNPMRATNCHIGILGHITRAELTRLLHGVELGNGFANRFLWCHSSRSKLLPDGGFLPPDALDGEIAVIKKVVDKIKSNGAFQMVRADKAKARWYEIYEPLTTSTLGRWGEVTRRGAAQVVRISMIFALLDGNREVSLAHLKAAEAVWKYCNESAKWAFEEHQYSYNAMKILTALEHKPLPYSEITNEVFKRNLRKSEIHAALDEIKLLIDVQWIERDGKVLPYWVDKTNS